MKTVLILLCMFRIVLPVIGQPVPEKVKPVGFDKKLVWGFNYHQAWSTIKGNSLANDYFAKPSLGVNVSVEYYPLSFIGIGIGAGYQQRGAGIRHTSQAPVAPNTPDSTYRERLRFNTLEFPISITLRTPKDLAKGLRLSASAAAVPMINLHSRDVFNVLEPSLHDTNVVNDVSSAYFKNDVAYQISIGPEIDSGGSGIVKVHFLYSVGTTNVYKSGQGNGHNQTVGLRLGILF